MRKSSFKQPSYTEALEKKKAAQQRARKRAAEKPHKPRRALKRKKTTTDTKKKKKKLPAVSTMRNKADKLLTPIIKLQHPYCYLQESENCAGVTQVAHHHVLKSQCTNLRYDLDNLIPLCKACHMMLHAHETYWSSVIVEKKGLDWWQKLKAKKPVMVKADRYFYMEHYERLRAILDGLE